MKDQTQTAIKLLQALTERAKELSCLYAIEESLKEPDADIDRVCERIIRAIPPGWQYPDCCVAKITLEGKKYAPPDYRETPWKLSANILQQDQVVGTIAVYYTEEMPAADVGPFLSEEKKLIETIADRLNHFLTYKKMQHVFHQWQNGDRDLSESRRGDWEAVLDLIRQTDNALFLRITNKMLNHLCWSGIEGAEELRRTHTQHARSTGAQYVDTVKPQDISPLLDFSAEFIERTFHLAAEHLSNEEILSRIQMWIQEDKLGTLLQTARRHLPLPDVFRALRRYIQTTHEDTYNRYPLAKGLKVLLVECILSDRLDYINLAKNHVEIEDLYELLQKVIYSPESHGKLGAKSAGFFLASQILKKTKKGVRHDSPYRLPKTWYVSSDMMLEFIHHNSMDEIVEQKYKEIERVRFEYPYVIEELTQSAFPPDLIKGLSLALDDFGDVPLVVRSSSLLADRMGLPFVGQYKSVFLGNQGTREQRLRDITTALAEVYASNFAPDPIEYRARRGLIEFSEQMGIMIQEVVGQRIGPYFLPAYSGVARSRNDLQWSSEIEPEDGVVRLIPGLGSRAADRSSDEYPVMFIPGRPTLDLNGAHADVAHSPKRVDVVNLETNRLETVELRALLGDFHDEYPQMDLVVSAHEEGKTQPLDRENPDFADGRFAVTFEGLIARSPFVLHMRDLLRTLEESLGVPVEIEFATDGDHLYIVQCQPQAILPSRRPSPIPKGIDSGSIVLSAKRHVQNGRASNITHVVYVDPDRFGALEEPADRDAVPKVVGELNRLLPKRQFILMAPGRPDVRGDGRPGLTIRISDLQNAAVLIELFDPPTNDSAVSFGVHFLQALTESNVLYLPFSPDIQGSFLNRGFVSHSHNILADLLPEYAFLDAVVRVIDISRATSGKVLQMLMNADLSEAVGLLTDRETDAWYPAKEEPDEDGHPESYWRWRKCMAEQVASRLDPKRFGVEGFYLFGSTKNGTAGPSSDIDVLIHFRGTGQQRQDLMVWLEGWSMCLDEVNYLRTGYRSGGLLDVHLVTDEDLEQKSSYAVKIDAVTDAARPLKMKESHDTSK